MYNDTVPGTSLTSIGQLLSLSLHQYYTTCFSIAMQHFLQQIKTTEKRQSKNEMHIKNVGQTSL